MTLPLHVGSFGELVLVTALPQDAETVTIDATVYTWKLVLGAPFDVQIPATSGDVTQDLFNSARNLNSAINADDTAGIRYAVGTTRHPTVQSVQSVGKPANVIVTANAEGSTGDAIVSTETMAGGSWGGVTLLYDTSGVAATMQENLQNMQRTSQLNSDVLGDVGLMVDSLALAEVNP